MASRENSLGPPASLLRPGLSPALQQRTRSHAIDHGNDLLLYETMLLIRYAEEAIRELYPQNKMKTPMHMSLGQEAVATGVCLALSAADQILSSYRTHAIYLARTRDTDGFFAELYGKATGPARGKAGSMHLASPEHGFLMSSAIVGSQIPVALGAAFANQQLRNNKVVAVFFGDGAVEEGCFWESVNLAALRKLPVLFVYEDNAYAVHTPLAARRGFANLNPILQQFDCLLRADVEDNARVIHRETLSLTAQMRALQRPGFLHVPCYRYLEHVGVNFDFEANYRSHEQFLAWQERDPVQRLRQSLLESRGAKEIAELEARLRDQVRASVERAEAAPYPDKHELHAHVFAGE